MLRIYTHLRLNAEKCREMQRNARKCREILRNTEKCTEFKRSVEKCREMQGNVEKLREMQRNAEKFREMQTRVNTRALDGAEQTQSVFKQLSNTVKAGFFIPLHIFDVSQLCSCT